MVARSVLSNVASIEVSLKATDYQDGLSLVDVFGVQANF